MSFDAKTLFELLPAIHRIRDAELARSQDLERGPLEELMAVLAEQIGVAEESLDQFYDDLFIETSADWVVPYIGDLIGYRTLHAVTARVASPRTEVAHTIALRRRKGTALVLEQLARDVTGWDARAVEYFDRLAANQYMNHIRLRNAASPHLGAAEPLESIGTAFETANRTVHVGRIETGRGRHNIPNVGIHLWRIQAYPHRESPAARHAERLYRANPLGHDVPLYNRPVAEDDISHLAEPDNVPWPLSRRRLRTDLTRHYGERENAGAPLDNPTPALVLTVDGTTIERDRIRICNLDDDSGTWAHTPLPDTFYSIDPVLGRVALPGDAADPADVRLTWHEGFVADIGGGEYERGQTLPAPSETVTVARVPDDHPTIAAALAQIAGDGIVEITDSSRYDETLDISVVADGRVEIRAVNGRRPFLHLGGLTVTGALSSACAFNGLLVAGAPLQVPDNGDNALERLDLIHCTFVPGIGLNSDGTPQQPTAPGLELELAGLETRIERSIVGAIRSHERGSLTTVDSVIDATSPDHVAFAELDGESPGSALSLDASTVIGKIHTSEIGMISNSILLAVLADSDTWSVPVRSARKQVGCVRFSWLPFDSIVPPRYRCQPASPADQGRIAPGFESRHYGTAAYCQLDPTTPVEIRRGADDESEMGVLHHLYGPQREINLRVRLGEYLRVGLLAGIFYES